MANATVYAARSIESETVVVANAQNQEGNNAEGHDHGNRDRNYSPHPPLRLRPRARGPMLPVDRGGHMTSAALVPIKNLLRTTIGVFISQPMAMTR